jgi:molybdate transport system substrate-binding protein
MLSMQSARSGRKDTGKKARISYRRARPCKQTEQGAPAQIFISADLDWMDYLAARNLINSDTRSNLLGNRLVLVAPKDKAQAIEIKQGFEPGQGFG